MLTTKFFFQFYSVQTNKTCCQVVSTGGCLRRSVASKSSTPWSRSRTCQVIWSYGQKIHWSANISTKPTATVQNNIKLGTNSHERPNLLKIANRSTKSSLKQQIRAWLIIRKCNRTTGEAFTWIENRKKKSKNGKQNIIW